MIKIIQNRLYLILISKRKMAFNFIKRKLVYSFLFQIPTFRTITIFDCLLNFRLQHFHISTKIHFYNLNNDNRDGKRKWSAEQTNQTEGHHRHFARTHFPTSTGRPLAYGSVFYEETRFFLF